MNEMEKAYEPRKYEAGIYEQWEKSGAFKPSDNPKAEPYSILMPPPNSNADLHLGHTLSTTIEDILIRFARMNGKAALYIPGADHAGFETQVVFERHLETEGKSRFDFERDELYQMIWDFVQANKANMENQQRRIGASADWDRNTFTLDPHVVQQAYSTFQRLWDDDLLYRGKRIVNYCTHHGTSFSDLEVVYRDENTSLWHFSYPESQGRGVVAIATTRPETMLGDTAVAVHPNDKRYKHLIGKTLTLPLVGREIPVIADEAVDPKFGTGAVKVTPAHDPTDFEIAERHNLPAIEVIGKDGLMTAEVPGKYRNLPAEEARKLVIVDLEKEGFHVKTEPYKHSVGHCYKCGTVIQPLILDQWLIRMKTLAQAALKALEGGEVKIVPASKKKELYRWLENIRDWNISRQIVWGIRIPAFISDDGNAIVDLEERGDEIKRSGRVYRRDPDTFDTWFSSGQWPEATVHYPGSPDFKRFYPSAVMETGADILFFWVARMLMLGIYITGEVPFRVVYLHGLIADEHGKKMSKSKGNVLTPTPLLDKYGADALRMGLVANRSAGQNQGFSEKRAETYRNFSNKLWNVARYILSTVSKGVDPHKPGPLSPTNPADEWILEKFSRENKKIAKALSEYRFSEALELLYSLLWDDLADWYVESSKLKPNEPILAYTLDTILRLTHPFAPFITEAIWSKLLWQSQKLITSSWPEPMSGKYDLARFEAIMALVSQIRTISSILGLRKPKLYISSDSALKSDLDLIAHLAKLGKIEVGKDRGLRIPSLDFDAWLEVDDKAVKEYLEILRKQHSEAEKNLDKLESQLKNRAYLRSAPSELVQQTRDRQKEAKLVLSKLDEQLRTAGK